MWRSRKEKSESPSRSTLEASVPRCCIHSAAWLRPMLSFLIIVATDTYLLCSCLIMSWVLLAAWSLSASSSIWPSFLFRQFWAAIWKVGVLNSHLKSKSFEQPSKKVKVLSSHLKSESFEQPYKKWKFWAAFWKGKVLSSPLKSESFEEQSEKWKFWAVIWKSEVFSSLNNFLPSDKERHTPHLKK